MTTVREALAEATRRLVDSPSARADAEVLLRHATGISRTDMAADATRTLAPTQYREYLDLIARRARGEPVAYVIGRREFWTLDLIVTPATLIPRPETELLVERTLELLSAETTDAVLDLGTGSGAIALAIAQERPRAAVTAIDQSNDALAVARTNAAHHDIRNVEFLAGNWFEPLVGRRFRAIASNPPYVRRDDAHLAEGDVRFEPRTALIGGDDGLEAIRHIIANAPAYLLAGGALLLEHGYDQAAAVKQLLIEHDYCDIRCSRDLSGHERVTQAQRAR